VGRCAADGDVRADSGVVASVVRIRWYGWERVKRYVEWAGMWV
jgi:hypothetical protein